MKYKIHRAALGITGALTTMELAAKDVPDILLITTDDQGIQAGCYGDPLAITPNLDRLAKEGVLFKNAYVTHASSSPSRSSILTGLYPHQNGHVGLAGELPEYAVKSSIATLPAILKNGGYTTGIIGKLHVMPADRFPFDFSWRETLIKPLLTRDVRKVADYARDFIAQTGEKPFFLYVNYFDPHRPYDADSNQYMGLPKKPYTAADVKPFGFLGDAASMNDMAAYYNCVHRMDTGLGMLFDELKKAGRYDNTLILFIGDNGPDFTRAKVTSYEAGLQVPFVVKWPGVSKAGIRPDAFVSAIDIMPTILDAAQIRCPAVAGVSLRGVLQGKTPDNWRKELFAEYTSHAKAHLYPRRTLREGKYKLIHNLDYQRVNPVPRRGVSRLAQLADPVMKKAFETDLNPPEWELYNLEKDPYEIKNLAENPEISSVLKRMQDLLLREKKRLNDPLLNPAELKRLKAIHGINCDD